MVLLQFDILKEMFTWHSISGSGDSKSNIDVCALSGEIVNAWKVVSFFSADLFSLSFCSGFAMIIYLENINV